MTLVFSFGVFSASPQNSEQNWTSIVMDSELELGQRLRALDSFLTVDQFHALEWLENQVSNCATKSNHRIVSHRPIRTKFIRNEMSYSEGEFAEKDRFHKTVICIEFII